MATKKTSAKASSKAQSATNNSNLIFRTPLGALFGEFIGTFILAAVVISVSGQPIFVLFALTAIVLAVGTLSGGHVNPAITFGAWITHRVSTLRALGYIVAQVLGAMLALVVLNAMVSGQPGQMNPLTGQAMAAEIFKAEALTEGKEWYAFFAEMLGAGIFGFAVASALREKRDRFAAAFTVGGGLFLGLIIAGSAAILNPAIAISLQAISWDTWPLAVYVFSPLVGAAIGFIIYQVLLDDVTHTNKLLKPRKK